MSTQQQSEGDVLYTFKSDNFQNLSGYMFVAGQHDGLIVKAHVRNYVFYLAPVFSL